MSTSETDRYAEYTIVRRALWRGLKWTMTGYILDADLMASGLADMLQADVTLRLLDRLDPDRLVDEMDQIEERIEARCHDIMTRVVAAVEAEGLAVPGVEGSVDRVLDAALHSVNEVTV